MSALPLPLAQALRAFSPPQESEAASLRRQLDALRSDWQSLLRLPFEVEFESLTPKTTRMRVVADSEALIKDSATATEIILQTERVLPAT